MENYLFILNKYYLFWNKWKGKKMVFLLEKEILEPVTNKKKIVQSVGEGKRVSPLISL